METNLIKKFQYTSRRVYYYGSAEGHEYPDLQVGDEVNPRTFFCTLLNR